MSFGDYSILFQKHSPIFFGFFNQSGYLTYYNQQNVGLVESKKGPSFPEGNGVLKNSLTPFDLLDSAHPPQKKRNGQNLPGEANFDLVWVVKKKKKKKKKKKEKERKKKIFSEFLVINLMLS